MILPYRHPEGRALARRLEGWPQALVAHPSRLAVKNGEHLRMTSRCGKEKHVEIVDYHV
jgi:hypothetical protein